MFILAIARQQNWMLTKIDKVFSLYISTIYYYNPDYRFQKYHNRSLYSFSIM